MCRTGKLYVKVKKNSEILDPSLILYTKITSELSKDLNMRTEIVKPSKGKFYKKCVDIGLGSEFSL